MQELPEPLREKIRSLGKRPGERMRPVILEICSIRPFTGSELTELLGKKNPHALKKDHLRPLLQSGELVYLYPDMEKHPRQAYQTPRSEGE